MGFIAVLAEAKVAASGMLRHAMEEGGILFVWFFDRSTEKDQLW